MMEDRSHSAAETAWIPEDSVASSRKQILVLEDDAQVVELLRPILEARGFQVTCVCDGADGLRALLRRDFAVILCDMVMPSFPGDLFYYVVQRVRPSLCARFLFMTGHRADPKIEAFMREVGGVMLWKPFKPQELLDAIKSVLSKAEEAPAVLAKR